MAVVWAFLIPCFPIFKFWQLSYDSRNTTFMLWLFGNNCNRNYTHIFAVNCRIGTSEVVKQQRIFCHSFQIEEKKHSKHTGPWKRIKTKSKNMENEWLQSPYEKIDSSEMSKNSSYKEKNVFPSLLNCCNRTASKGEYGTRIKQCADSFWLSAWQLQKLKRLEHWWTNFPGGLVWCSSSPLPGLYQSLETVSTTSTWLPQNYKGSSCCLKHSCGLRSATPNKQPQTPPFVPFQLL